MPLGRGVRMFVVRSLPKQSSVIHSVMRRRENADGLKQWTGSVKRVELLSEHGESPDLQIRFALGKNFGCVEWGEPVLKGWEKGLADQMTGKMHRRDCGSLSLSSSFGKKWQ